MRIRRHVRLTTVAIATALVLAGTAAAAFVGLPADGSQVNNDTANGIDPAQDAGVSDVQGGTVVAGNLQVPWAAFEQKTGSSQQIFVRAFKAGAWVTQGFPASLNIDPTRRGRGSHRSTSQAPAAPVPWVAWYEPNGNFSAARSRSSRAASRRPRTSGCRRARIAHRPARCRRSTSTRTATRRIPPSSAARPSRAPTPFPGSHGRSSTERGAGTNQIFVSRGVKQAAHRDPVRRQAGERRPERQRLLLAAGRARSDRPDDRRVLGDAATRR